MKSITIETTKLSHLINGERKRRQRKKTKYLVYLYKGEWRTLKEWAVLYGIKYWTLYMRLNRYGLNMDDALNRKIHKQCQGIYWQQKKNLFKEKTNN